MKNHVEVFEDQRAVNYDQFVENWIPQYHNFINLLPALLNSEITDQNRLLVAGCGTGNEMAVLHRQLKNWQITGVDPSPEMISQARKKLSRLERIDLIEGRVDELDQTNFDAATLLLVLHFMPDDGTKLGLLKDISERLATGAPLIILDIFGAPNEIDFNLQVLRSLLPKHVELEEIEERVKRIKDKIQYIPESRLEELLVEAGFEKPERFHHVAVYGGWLVRKATTS